MLFGSFSSPLVWRLILRESSIFFVWISKCEKVDKNINREILIGEEQNISFFKVTIRKVKVCTSPFPIILSSHFFLCCNFSAESDNLLASIYQNFHSFPLLDVKVYETFLMSALAPSQSCDFCMVHWHLWKVQHRFCSNIRLHQPASNSSKLNY